MSGGALGDGGSGEGQPAGACRLQAPCNTQYSDEHADPHPYADQYAGAADQYADQYADQHSGGDEHADQYADAHADEHAGAAATPTYADQYAGAADQHADQHRRVHADQTPTNTPVPPTNTPTNTPVPPTNTPTPTHTPPAGCGTCNLYVYSVSASCAPGGAITFTVVVRNNVACDVVTPWSADLGELDSYSPYPYPLVETLNGAPTTFAPGDTTLTQTFPAYHFTRAFYSVWFKIPENPTCPDPDGMTIGNQPCE